MVHIYTMECCSAMKRNEFESTELRWMKLELVIQTEVKSEREKHIIYHIISCIINHIKYHILTNIYMESQKMVLMNLFVGGNTDSA